MSVLSVIYYNDAPLLVPLVLLGITLSLFMFRETVLSLLKTRKSSNTTYTRSSQANIKDPNKDREFGEWTPVDFSFPPIEACKERITDIKPIPYRPFKWGPYHVTMGLKSMLWNEWIELDSEFEKYHRIKTWRMQIRGDKAVQVLPDSANSGVVRGGDVAAIELVHYLAEYLSRRYPADYVVLRHDCRSAEIVNAEDKAQAGCPNNYENWGWDGLPPIKSVKVVPLGIEYTLPLSAEDGKEAGKRAMEIAGLLVQDDLALMIEGNDGRYYFQAGSICVPGFWRMQDKIGMPLDDIHLSGNVPQYKERLQPSLDRFFRKLAVDKPVTRINYFVQTRRRDYEHGQAAGDEIDPDELGWAMSSLGDEDDFENGTHATAKPKNAPAQMETPVDWMRLRCERQTLLRLPRSGAVVFTIRVYITPMLELAAEQGASGRMASALRSWPSDVAGYKGKNRGGWWNPLLRFLDAKHEAEGTESVGPMLG